MKEGKLVCPVCGGKLRFEIIGSRKVGGEGYLIFSFFCERCGYKGADVFPEKYHEPRKLVFKVDEKEKINTLVARSSSATLLIPELGIEIKPGPASKGFITTVEGILLRVIDVMKGLKLRGKERKEKEILQAIENPNFTLIILDPMGTSAIDSRDVEILPLGEEKDFKRAKLFTTNDRG